MRKLVFRGVEVILPDEATVEVFSPKIKLWLVKQKITDLSVEEAIEDEEFEIDPSIADAIIDFGTIKFKYPSHDTRSNVNTPPQVSLMLWDDRFGARLGLIPHFQIVEG